MFGLAESIVRESEAESAAALIPLPPINVEEYERECAWCMARFRPGLCKSRTQGRVCCCPEHQKEWEKYCRWWKARGLNPRGMQMTRTADGRVTTVKQAEIDATGSALEDQPKWMQLPGPKAACVKCGDSLGVRSWEYKNPKLFCGDCVYGSDGNARQMLWAMGARRWWPRWARTLRRKTLQNARASRHAKWQEYGTAPPLHVYTG